MSLAGRWRGSRSPSSEAISARSQVARPQVERDCRVLINNDGVLTDSGLEQLRALTEVRAKSEEEAFERANRTRA
jgi:hypothetical protein